MVFASTHPKTKNLTVDPLIRRGKIVRFLLCRIHSQNRDEFMRHAPLWRCNFQNTHIQSKAVDNN